MKTSLQTLLPWRAGDGSFSGEGLCLLIRNTCCPTRLDDDASYLLCCRELLDEGRKLEGDKTYKAPPRSNSPGGNISVGFEI